MQDAAYTDAVQAALFASAAIVVAPHGAALHNLAFATPGRTATLELPPVWQATYALFSHAVGHVYRKVRHTHTPTTTPTPTP